MHILYMWPWSDVLELCVGCWGILFPNCLEQCFHIECKTNFPFCLFGEIINSWHKIIVLTVASTTQKHRNILYSGCGVKFRLFTQIETFCISASIYLSSEISQRLSCYTNTWLTAEWQHKCAMDCLSRPNSAIGVLLAFVRYLPALCEWHSDNNETHICSHSEWVNDPHPAACITELFTDKCHNLPMAVRVHMWT